MSNREPLTEHTIGIVFDLWMRSAIAAAIITAAGFYLLDELAARVVFTITFLLLGIPQGIIMHRYAHRVHWSQWLLFTSLGTLLVMPVGLVLELLVEAGGGLNPGTDVRGCLLQGAAVLGFGFGAMQNARSSASLVWGFVYAFAVTAGALIGGVAGFWVYHQIRPPFAYGATIPSERATGVAVGFLVGMMVYGLVTGLAVAYSVRWRALVQDDVP